MGSCPEPGRPYIHRTTTNPLKTMASVNKVILIGNLGADPERRVFPNGDTVVNLRLATTDKWKDRQTGEDREQTEWHRIVLYRRLAEIAAQYLKKGAPIYVEGRLRTRKWQDKDGQDRYTTEVEASELRMLGAAPGKNTDRNSPPANSTAGSTYDPGEDYPF